MLIREEKHPYCWTKCAIAREVVVNIGAKWALKFGMNITKEECTTSKKYKGVNIFNVLFVALMLSVVLVGCATHMLAPAWAQQVSTDVVTKIQQEIAE